MYTMKVNPPMQGTRMIRKANICPIAYACVTGVGILLTLSTVSKAQ